MKHNLGEFPSIEKVWDIYPNGGGEGDYITINGIAFYWNEDDRSWGDKEPGEIPPQGGVISGDLKVTGKGRFGDNLTVGEFLTKTSGARIYKNGDAEFRSVKVDGLWIKNAQGQYVELSELAGSAGLDWEAYTHKILDGEDKLALYNPATKETHYTTIGAINAYIQERSVPGTGEPGTGTGDIQILIKDGTLPSTDSNVWSSLRSIQEIEKRAISKTKPDTAEELIKFRKGIEVGTYTPGTLGGGGVFKMIDGFSHLEVDQLDVRQRATFNEIFIKRSEQISGELIISGAGLICNHVDEFDDFFRCYFDDKEGEIPNYFKAGDLAKAQIFKGLGESTEPDDPGTGPIILSSFYWREVTAVDTNFIELSKTNYAAGSGVPKKGDHIIQLGNLTDPTRQNAQILSSIGPRSPSIIQYAGISGFSLEGKQRTAIFGDGSENVLYGKVRFMSGGTEGDLPDIIDGVTIDAIDVEYAKSFSDTTAPTTGWTTNAPTSIGEDEFIWSRTKLTFADGRETYTNPSPLLNRPGRDGADGVDGIDGIDGVSTYTWVRYADDEYGTGIHQYPAGKKYIGFAYNKNTATESSDPVLYNWSLIQGAEGQKGEVGDDGIQYYFWLKYADTPTSGMSDDPAGKNYMGIAVNRTTATESTNYSDYKWQLTKGSDGANGIDGIEGPKGADGATTYTWVRYADDASGGGINQYPAGKKYIGIAYNKTTATESSNPDLYKWSLIQGETGQKGEVGDDAIQYYFWLKYADTPTSGMSDDPTGKKYMGIAVNKLTATESTNYNDYSWQLTAGSDGLQGIQGPKGETGSPTYTWVRYADNASGGGINQYPAGKKYIGIAYNKTTATESSNPDLYKWSLIQGEEGQKGLKGDDGVQYYNWIKYADSPTSGMSDDPAGKKYMGIAVNKLTATESTEYTDYTWQLTKGVGIHAIVEEYYPSLSASEPTGSTWRTSVPTPAVGIYIWTRSVVYYDDEPTQGYPTSGLMASGFHGKDGTGVTLKPSVATWEALPKTGNTTNDARMTRDSGRIWVWDETLDHWVDGGPFKGDTGAVGPPGVAGEKGADGATTYTWVRYADDASGGGIDQFPAGKKYIGFAYNKTTSVESNTPSHYKWSLIQGAEGQKGEVGDDGTQYYFWLKYADTPTSGMSDDPRGKDYMGIAVNKLTATESTNYNDYSWQLTVGQEGPQGIRGLTGASGVSYYTWVRYADTSTGTGIHQYPAGKKYIGFAYNKTTPTESSDPDLYNWSLIQGAEGQKGEVGDDGIQYYFWLKYADTPTSGMSDDPAGKKYMGIAVNKLTATESTNYNDYSWQLTVGSDGPQGIQGPKGATGSPTYTWVRYADDASGGGINQYPAGKKYIGFAYNKTTPTESSTPSDYKWSLIQGETGQKGEVGANGTQYYFWLKYADTPISGMSDNPAGKKYMGIAVNKLTATESTNYNDYSWQLTAGSDGHSPYIGSNGNWYVWDSDRSPAGYIDSGDPAIPDAGRAPRISASGFWETYNHVTKVWVATGIKAQGGKGDTGTPGVDAVIAFITKQGSFKTEWSQYGSDGKLLGTPTYTRSVIGGVRISSVDYVQCKVTFIKGGVDITASVFADSTLKPKWYVNNSLQPGQVASILNLNVTFATGVDKNIRFEYDDVNQLNW